MDLAPVLESLLFSSQKPLSASELRKVLKAAAENAEDESIQALGKTKTDAVEACLQKMALDLQETGRAFQLINVACSWQYVTHPDYAPWIRALVGEKDRPQRLSQAALETLAVIAYRQPATRSEIEQVRGVSVDGVVQKLLERGLIEEAGRAELVGRPMTYRTTHEFLEYFGLSHMDELPNADELRRIPVERPSSLVTAEADSQGDSEADGSDDAVGTEETEGATKETSESGSEPGGQAVEAALSDDDGEATARPGD